MKIVERFVSIQGEGILTGVRMYFVRFPFCNLNCSWCDTKYANKPKIDATVQEILRGFYESATTWICITGGEPLLHHIDAFIGIIPREKRINVQTNGTIKPSDGLVDKVNFWSVSPKLKSSGNADAINLDVLESFVLPRRCEWKFVVNTSYDFQEIERIVSNFNMDMIPIIIQPNGFRLQEPKFLQEMWELTMKLQELARGTNHELCDVRFMIQTHRIVWGSNRGI